MHGAGQAGSTRKRAKLRRVNDGSLPTRRKGVPHLGCASSVLGAQQVLCSTMDKARFVPCQQHSSSSTLHVWLVGSSWTASADVVRVVWMQ